MKRFKFLSVILGPVILIMFNLLHAITASNARSDETLLHRDIQGNYLDLWDWHPKYKDRCYFPDAINPVNENTNTIKTILAELDKEPFLSSFLLDKAEYLNTAFCIEDRADGTRGYYDYKYNIIAVRENLDLMTKIIIFIHELRHVDQLSRGFCQSLVYDADEMIRMNFAAEADANAVLALYAWRSKEDGYPQAWDKLFELSKYSDIYSAFETEIQTSEDEVKATRIAFIQWYKSEWRTTNYYRSCLGGYLDMLDDTKLIRQYRKLPENYFNNLCTLPDGNNYDCHLTAEIKSMYK